MMNRKPAFSLESDDKEPPQPEKRISNTEKIFFENGTAIHFMFARNIPGNLKYASERLGVHLISRDGWIQISADHPEKTATARKFLSELSAASKRAGNIPLGPVDFEQILTACCKHQEELLMQCYTERIKVSSRKKEIIPRTPNQLLYIRQIRSHDITFGLGPAGTGKTFLAMAMAVSALLSGQCERIILTRPAVEAGESLGFLPGTLQDKVNPYLRPLYDALYDMLDSGEAQPLMERGIIEVAPLAFMRGRTLNHAFVILDEAQNATHEQMLMFLTRLGFGSKCVVCGDPTQTDLGIRKKSGLLQAAARLEPMEEIAVCRFRTEDVVRHTLVEKIIRAYENPQPDYNRRTQKSSAFQDDATEGNEL